jgi:hypothetical protein
MELHRKVTPDALEGRELSVRFIGNRFTVIFTCHAARASALVAVCGDERPHEDVKMSAFEGTGEVFG